MRHRKKAESQERLGKKRRHSKQDKTAESKHSQKTKKTTKKTRRTAQDALDFEALTESGIAWLGDKKWSATIRLGDIDYQLAPEELREAIIEKWASFLNGHLAGQHVQITILNQILDKEHLLDEVALSPRGDGFDAARGEYNTLISQRLESDRQNVLTEKFVTITVEAESYEEARTQLGRIVAEDIAALREVGGCRATQLTGKERAQILQQMLRPGAAADFEYRELLAQKSTVKDHVSPWLIDDASNKDHVRLASVGERYWKTLVLRRLPPWMSDRLLKEISEIPVNLTVSVHLDPIDQAEGVTLVKRQIAGMDIQRSNEQRKLMKQGLTDDLMPHELQAAYEEATQLRTQLEQSNEKLFTATIVVGVAGETVEELDEAVARVMRVCGKHSCQLETLRYMQRDGLNAILPVGVNTLPVFRTITTAVAAVLVPFTTQEILEPGGMFYGVNALSKNLIVADRTATMNANGFILGSSGSGKSQFAKFEMEQIFLRRPTDDILIIDPEREYGPLALELNASRVVISAGSSHTLNALHLDKQVDGLDVDPVREKCTFVLALCEVLIGGSQGLPAEKRSIIDRAAQRMYSEYWNTPGALSPTLMTLFDVLRTEPEPEAREIATALELYARGSASGFAQQTNVDTSNRVVVFDIADLGRDLQTFGMMVVLEEIWSRVVKNKAAGKRTWIYLDEFHLLFANEWAAAYCQGLFKRVRKYGASATGITQNIEELLANERARLMLANSDGLFLLNQQATDADALTDLLDLSTQQRSAFVNQKPGCGLMRVGHAQVPFDNTMDPNSRIFEVFSTRFKEAPNVA